MLLVASCKRSQQNFRKCQNQPNFSKCFQISVKWQQIDGSIDRLPFVNFGDFDSLGVEVLVLARWGKGKKWDFLRIFGGFVLKGSKMS